MRSTRATTLALGSAATALLLAGSGHDEWEEFSPPPPFAMATHSIGGVRPVAGAPAHLTSSRIAALDDGALVSDADSGMLIRTDATGAARTQLAIGADAGLLAYDATAKRAYVADRSGDRIVVVTIGEQLVATTSWKTPAEPYGVALTPDRRTLLVTTIADRTLVAFDVDTGRQRWRAPLEPEPRGIAVSPDGKRALVTSLTTGAVAQIALAERAPVTWLTPGAVAQIGANERPAVHRIALPTRATNQRARGAFAVAFVGDMAVAPYQLEIPVANDPDASGQYGGSFTPPISHHVAWLGADGRSALAQTNVHEPRALAWDAARDTLYLAGLASDSIVVVRNASQVDVTEGSAVALSQRCGADGLALAADGTLLVWCSFTRSIARFAPRSNGRLAKVVKGPELVASTLDAQRHTGLVLFHSANHHLSAFAGLSCGNCHLDGRADGLSWQIGQHALQTPILAGRIAGTAPYKWDGTAKDLPHSLRQTIGRLGGTGLSKRDLAALTTFVESMPAIRAPTRNPAAVARGKQLFASTELGCANCHEGNSFTDRDRHELGGTRGAFDTPGLAALAASAPYFHDGSAATLEQVLRDRGRVHGMSDEATKLDAARFADLTAFLESL